MWNSSETTQHCTKKDGHFREDLLFCRVRNVINNSLVVRDKILLPPLHIMLGFIQQYTKIEDKDGGCFNCLCHAFPVLTIGGMKSVIFNGPEIRQLIRCLEFENAK